MEGKITEWRSNALPRYQRLAKKAEALIASVFGAASTRDRPPPGFASGLVVGCLTCAAIRWDLRDCPFLRLRPSFDAQPRKLTDIRQGLAPLRREWIAARGDVEDYGGRGVKPEDNGFVEGDRLTPEFPVKRRPLRARDGKAATRLAYARAGVITPEMEFGAIRENQLREAVAAGRDGNDWGTSIPD